MGTWTRNFLVANANPAEVREKVVQWLERKGFDLKTQPSLMDSDEDDTRNTFIISNRLWTAVIYSEAFKEGDRLLKVLDGFPTVLEVWIADSDVWGYELYETGELTVSFNSNPGYFGREELKMPQNGDAPRLCRALGISGKVNLVRAAERRRSLFSDIPCEKFCHIIEAIPGTLHAADLEHWNQGRISAQEVEGWLIEPLLFEKRRPLEEADENPSVLQSLTIRSFHPQEHREPLIDPEYFKAMQCQIQVLVWLFRPIGWLLAVPFLFKIWLHQFGFLKPKRKGQPGYGLLEAIGDAPKPWYRDGEWLVNLRHSCRIHAPEQVKKPVSLFFSLTEVFHFTVAGVEVFSHAIRKHQLRRRHFDLTPSQTLLNDENFFAGQNPGRLLVVQTDHEDRHSVKYVWLIEQSEVIYEFIVSSGSALPNSVVARIFEVVRTFESHLS